MRRSEFLLMAAVLGVAAWLSPQPWWQTDRDVYERMGPRVARAWMQRLSLFPSARLMDPRPHSRTAARDVEDLRGALPGRRRTGDGLVGGDGDRAATARKVGWLTALGSGACYTLFDPYSSIR
jgi:hypothetical protein